MKKVRKHYELSEVTNRKLQQLTEIKNKENETFGLSKASEKSIIEESIELMHSSKFGVDVFDQTITKLETILGNMMINVLNEYATRFSSSLDNLHFQNSKVSEMLLLILNANDILPESQTEINSLIMLNDKLDNLLTEAMLLKQEMGE